MWIWSWDKKRKRVFDVAFCCRCPTIPFILRRNSSWHWIFCVRYLETVDCRIFVIRSPWLWRYTGKVSIWSRYLSNQHFGPRMVTNIIFVAHIERVGIVDANPTQWDSAEKDMIGESSSLPNNSIPPAGPFWPPSYLWQPTKLVRVISGYPEWRLFPAGGRSTSGETWLGAEVGTHRGFLTFLQSACSHDFPQIVSSQNWCQNTLVASE